MKFCMLDSFDKIANSDIKDFFYLQELNDIRSNHIFDYQFILDGTSGLEDCTPVTLTPFEGVLRVKDELHNKVRSYSSYTVYITGYTLILDAIHSDRFIDVKEFFNTLSKLNPKGFMINTGLYDTSGVYHSIFTIKGLLEVLYNKDYREVD